jgi:Domain of unknown function (DUF6268)
VTTQSILGFEMRRAKKWGWYVVLSGLLGLVDQGAFAQTTRPSLTASQVVQSHTESEIGPPWSFDINGEYTFGSRLQDSHGLGHQSETRFEVEVLKNFRLTGNYYLQVGFDYERFDFSRSNDLYPYSLTGANAEINFSYWSGDSYYPVIEIEPGIYYTRDHVTRNSFDVPIRLTPGFQLTKSLYVIGGCSIDPFNNPVVYPIAGLNWVINKQWNFRAVFPRPRLSYSPNDSLELYVGGELTGAGYRNGPTNDRRTNNAIVEYSSTRAGVGANYTLRKGVSFEAVAGWTFERTTDYIRSGPVLNSRGSPYIRAELSIDLF